MRTLMLMVAVWRAAGTPTPLPSPAPTVLPLPAPTATPATPVPSLRPTISAAPSSSATSAAPFPTPTAVPTPQPSLSCTGGPGESIYRFRMYDSGCDGWQLTHYIVYSSSEDGEWQEGEVVSYGTLETGCEGSDWMCLTNGCYELVVSGGYNLDEVSFDFRDQAERHFDGGRHFQDLTLDDATGSYQDHFCVRDGDLFDNPTGMPSVSPVPSPLPTVSPAPSASPRPSGVPTSAPSEAPTSLPSPAPSTPPSPAPTPMPSPGCHNHLERHYRLRLYDTGGDGWQGVNYVIRYSDFLGFFGEGNVTASGTLASGSYGVDWLCLLDGCYELGIEYDESVVDAATLAEIGFEFMDEGDLHFQDLAAPYEEHFCVARGDLFAHPTAQPTVTFEPSPLPTVSPYPTISPHPTPVPSAPPSPLPTMPPTPLPTLSPMPTPVPTITPHPTVSHEPSALPTPAPTSRSSKLIDVVEPFHDWPLVFGIAFTCVTLLIAFVVCLYAPMCPLYSLVKGGSYRGFGSYGGELNDVELPAFSSSLAEDRPRGAPGGGRAAAAADDESPTRTTHVPNPFQPAAAFSNKALADRCEKEHTAFSGDETKAGPPPAPAPAPAPGPAPGPAGFSNFDTDFDALRR